MTMNLATMYQISPQPLDKGIIKNFQEASELMDTLDFEDIKALTVETTRSGELREVGWRRINEPFQKVLQGNPEKVQAGIHSFGTPIDIDYLIEEDQTPKIVDPIAQQVADTTEAMAKGFTDAWVNNTPITDDRKITGIKYIIDTEFPDQKIIAYPSGLDVLDLSPTGANYAQNISLFFLALDTAIGEIDGKPNFAVCNKVFLRNFRRICRDSGYLKTTEDSLGRSFLEYDGIKFIDARSKVSSDKDLVISNSETYNGVEDPSGNCTSVYFVRMDKTHYQPWQYEKLNVVDVGLLDNGVQRRKIVRWDVGHIVTHKKSLTRLCGLKF